ncbi:MAG: sulfite exporter TauE/SafE family protein [Planctomycetes bacterium]|nr:sulfite exporter TauE/SafE family protein [Planctomycetota bacterium]
MSAERAPGPWWALVAAGLLMGIYSTLCGIGGGIFAVPLLHYVYRLPLRRAVANSLALVAGSTSGATLLEALHPESALRLDLVLALVTGSVVGSRLGFALGRAVSARGLKAVFVLLLLLVSVQLLWGGGAAQAFEAAALPAQRGWAEWALVGAIGLAAGVVAPLLGIGGGLVAVPAMIQLLPGLGFLAARACSMAMSAVNAWQSLWLYRREGEIRGAFSTRLMLGAVLGSALGIQLVHVEPVTRAARVLVAIALLFAAARFALDLLPRARRPGV